MRWTVSLGSRMRKPYPLGLTCDCRREGFFSEARSSRGRGCEVALDPPGWCPFKGRPFGYMNLRSVHRRRPKALRPARRWRRRPGEGASVTLALPTPESRACSSDKINLLCKPPCLAFCVGPALMQKPPVVFRAGRERDLQKCKTMPLFSLNFLGENIVFHQIYCFVNMQWVHYYF